MIIVIAFYIIILLPLVSVTRTKQHTAILIFSRTAEEEAGVKSFHKRAGKKLNQLIARVFIANTRQKAAKTGLPVITHFSNTQVGSTFGERMTYSMRQVFAQGYDNVIVLGSDCAALCDKALLKAANELERTGFALGPDERGGAYLIGISKQYFCEQTLLNISWNTPKVYEELLAYAGAHNSPCVELEQKPDINTQRDIERLLPGFKWELGFIYAIFKELRATFAIYQLRYELSAIAPGYSLRGPPL